MKRSIAKPVFSLLLIVLLATLAVVFIPEKQADGLIPPQEIKQNTQHRLYIGTFFRDPDGDALTYKATPMKHITTDFIENTVIFTPEENFIGEENVKITASDGEGGTITSNSIPIRVKRFVLPSTWTLTFVFAGLAIISLLLLIFSYRKSQKNKKN